jgi:hypothetical protein
MVQPFFKVGWVPLLPAEDMQRHARGLGPGKARGCPRGPEMIYPKWNALKRFRRAVRFRGYSGKRNKERKSGNGTSPFDVHPPWPA